MNAKIILVSAIALFFTKVNTGEDIVKLMYKKYAGKWARTLVFDQTTDRYRDTVKTTQTWHESMYFPDKLRIDMEPVATGSTSIYRADSTYTVRNGKVTASANGNDLIFLLGGLYFYPLDKSIEKLKSQGYDLSKAGEDTFEGKAVYIIGASNKDEKVNQLWVNKDDLYLVRMIKYNKNPQGVVTKQDATFGGYIKMGGGGAETKVMFYVNDKLLQAETYYNCRQVPGMDQKIFDPWHFEKIVYKD
jgi:hypothetical protein